MREERVQQTVRNLLYILCLIPTGSGGLEMLGINSPKFASSGETVELVCKYDVGRDAIYSVKWYKDGSEIWRYIPSDNPSFKYFPSPGINILDISRPHKLVLILEGPKGSGEYKCEISVEAPTFYTQNSSSNLTVVVPPTSAPEITGGQEYYALGDILELNCTVHRSKPAANLRWKVNGNLVDSSQIEFSKSIMHDTSGLETSILGLRYATRREDFPGGVARVRCEAEIAGGVWATSQSQAFSGGPGGLSTFSSAPAGDVNSSFWVPFLPWTLSVLGQSC
ncbi:uncharacterized protein LOC111712606 isoform X2 [Eurytemora carolleeae]|uniref:uncharacterized protein LOC111712606 isoform X2 n=1 Tax=Eurytemora carolleeae TaxID=1294199 RepID=UPI000C75CE62|nr:uncharacterized protein LOC111712606 isoform X2 [Eurytemora carolleeae]|eukprot:XP_023343029.1 uncharacterized protein LOC111712606 isoform X2 [Eurytemora affinis]